VVLGNMSKCSKIGCDKEGIPFPYPIFGGEMMAEIITCSMEHFEEARKSLDETNQ